MSQSVISGKYEILRKLGQGGMGTVYKVRHTDLDTIFALKLMPDHLADNPDLVARFRREAKVMAQLRHENIVRVFDITRDRNLYYLVEEFIEGQDLAEHIKAHGALPFEQVLAISRQIADALGYAHEQGVVHRDIKPSNVLIEQRVPVRALLTDFGIAKVEDAGDRTQTGMLLGTVKYSPPEQLGYRGNERSLEVDARADVYALGLVMYEMIERRAFFADVEQHQIIGRLVYEREPLVPKFSRPVPAPLTALITRAIARDPSDRHQDMRELLNDLDVCARAVAPTSDGATVVSPRATFRPPPVDDATPEELDVRIHALEIERDRRRAVTAQAQARAAREHACNVGAAELVAALFAEGTAAEAAATVALKEERCKEARAQFEEATQSFTRAAEAAEAARSRQASEAARRAMLEAKRTAEQAHASDLARTLYGRALSREDEGEARLEARSFADATHAFAEAQQLYTESCARALTEAQRAAAEQARNAMEAQRAIAVAAHAAAFAATRLGEADESARLAVAALADARFTAAQELFAKAGALYGRTAAEAEAEEEVQRGEATAADQRAERARAHAERAQVALHADALHQQGLLLVTDARSALQERRYGDARDRFEQAAQVFVAATQRAELVAAAIRDTEQAAAAAGAHQRDAEAVGAAQHAADVFARARSIGTAADTHRERGAHADAIAAYHEAGQLYAAAIKATNEVLLRNVERAREALNRARTEAMRANLADGSTDAADATARQAEGALAAGRLAEAATFFSRAANSIDRAVATAQRELLHRRALQAQQRARAMRARGQANEAALRAAQLTQSGLVAEQEGERALDNGDYSVALARFEDAAVHFQHAADNADAECARERAAAIAEQHRLCDAAQRRAQEALGTADEVDSQRYAADLYQQGQSFQRQAAQAAQQERFSDARDLFEQAEQLWNEAARTAVAMATAKRVAAEHAAAEERRRATEVAAQRAAEERAARERAARELAAQERAARERAARERAEQERLAAEQAARERAEQERLAAEQAARERAEQERLAAEQAARERAEQARLAAEQAARERAARERAEQARLAAEQAARERAARERAERDRQAAEQAARERAARERAERDRQAAEQAARKRAAHERAERDRQAAERASRERAAQEEVQQSRATRIPLSHDDRNADQEDRTLSIRSERERSSSHVEQHEARTADSVHSQRKSESRMPLFVGGTLAAVALCATLAWYLYYVPSRGLPEPTAQLVPTIRPVAPTIVAAAVTIPVPAPQVPSLAWSRIEPSTPEAHVAEGAQLQFSVAVTQRESPINPTYAWFLDRTEQAATSAWTYEPGFDQGGTTHEVRVVASSGDEHIEQSWRVGVTNTNRPPEIHAAIPSQESITMAGDAWQAFAVAASDPDAAGGDTLSYRWDLNGNTVSHESSWTLSSLTTDEAAVTVHVTDGSGGATAHTWKVSRLDVPKTIDHPPRVLSQSPANNQVVSVEEGTSVNFSVRADDQDAGDQVSYAWRLDGREVGKNESWKFTAPDVTEKLARHEVVAELRDTSGLKAAVEWKIDIKAVAPKIIHHDPPQSRIKVAAGDSMEFGAAARSKTLNPRLRWSIDGREVESDRKGRMRLPSNLDIGSHVVEVAAIDARDLVSAPHRWSLEVQERAAPTREVQAIPPTQPQVAVRPTAEPPRPTPLSVAAAMSQSEARQWLVRFTNAWQQKDVNGLRALGVIRSTRQAEALERVLQSYGSLRVAIRNERIDIDGDEATVSFDRIDTDENGRQLTHPRESYRLVKGPNGVVASD